MLKPWTMKIADRNSGRESAVPWWVNDKYKLHTFCEEHGFPMPELYGSWKTPSEMNLDHSPTKFVLKPTVMFSSWGVMLLEKRAHGTFYEGLTGRTLSVEQIQGVQQEAYDRCQFKNSYRLMMEEKIEGPRADQPIPFDYKVSVFYDQPALVQQINRNPKRSELAFFDGNFDPLDLDNRITIDTSTKALGQHERPGAHAEMLQIASNLTQALRTPFLRVDMFAGPHGPVVGELTPSPGGAFYGNSHQYTHAYDTELGHAWLNAEKRLDSGHGP